MQKQSSLFSFYGSSSSKSGQKRPLSNEDSSSGTSNASKRNKPNKGDDDISDFSDSDTENKIHKKEETVSDLKIQRADTIQLSPKKTKNPNKETKTNSENIGDPNNTKTQEKEKKEKEKEKEKTNKNANSDTKNSPNSSTSLVYYQWSWNSENKWIPYSKEINDKLEKSYQNKDKERRLQIPVDGQRFVDLAGMVQRRYDNMSKFRSVKREKKELITEDSNQENSGKGGESSKKTSQNGNNRTTENETKKENNEKQTATQAPTSKTLDPPGKVKRLSRTPSAILAFQRSFEDSEKKRIQGRRKSDKDQNSGQPTKDNEDEKQEVVWYWRDDNESWQPYSDEIIQLIEKKFKESPKQKDQTVKVDDHRYVDVENMLQRRYDNPGKRRYIKRVGPSPGWQRGMSDELSQEMLEGYAETAESAENSTQPKTSKKNQPTDGDDTEPDDDSDSNELKKEMEKEKMREKEREKEKEKEKKEKEKPKNKEKEKQKEIDKEKEKSKGKKDKEKLESESESEDSEKEEKRKKFKEKERQEEREREKERDRKKRRKYYKCGDDYMTLNDLVNWDYYLSKNKLRISSREACKPSPKFNKLLSLWKGDITRLEIDAIVNAAKPSLLGGGGVDGAIHKAAGRGLLEECALLNGCEVGKAVITGGHKLPAQYVIHTVGPVGEKEKKLQSCYKKILKIVQQFDIQSVAFCCISTGIYGYPKKSAAKVALSTVRDWLESSDYAEKIKRIIFCVFEDEDEEIYERIMMRYFPPERNDSDSDSE